MTFDAFEVVAVPFPFTDRTAVKRRPALVLSVAEHFGDSIGHSVLAMITSAKRSSWPLDVPITDLVSAGLPSASLVRMKLFTLDHTLIIRRSGALGRTDRAMVQKALDVLFAKD